jgi:hypothetical protein
VNAAVVLLLPALAEVFTSALRATLPAEYASATVRAATVTERAMNTSLVALPVSIPLAAIAAWRTWVHATRWLNQRRAWWGVAEAGALGGVFVGGMLGSAAIAAAARGSGSIWAIPAIALYAGIGACVGLLVGLILQLTAVLLLTIAGRWMAADL